MSAATLTDRSVATNGRSNRLTETLEEKLSHPAASPDFDLKKGVNEVLADVGMTSDDCGGELSFYGSDPILPSPLRFGTMAAIGLAARSVAVAALWRQATGEGQKISVDVRKALRRSMFRAGQLGSQTSTRRTSCSTAVLGISLHFNKSYSLFLPNTAVSAEHR
jgi:hypothetical protein